MVFFHNYIITYWQSSMLKIAVLALGMIFGATWPAFFKKPVVWWILWVVFVIFSVILLVQLWPQISAV
jgi:hypothetical protein